MFSERQLKTDSIIWGRSSYSKSDAYDDDEDDGNEDVDDADAA